MIQDFLSRLASEQSDEGRLAVTLELGLMSLPEPTRDAVWAAAIPHWFDAPVIQALLGPDRFAGLAEVNGFEQLLALSYVESLPDGSYAVHERSRRALRGMLRQRLPERFQEFSERAWQHFSARDEPTWAIERVYHLLVNAPSLGVDEMNALAWRWQNLPDPLISYIESLIGMSREHQAAGLLSPLGMAWLAYWEAHLDVTYERYWPAQTGLTKLVDSAPDDQFLMACSLSRLGDAHYGQAEYRQAEQRYIQALRVYATLDDIHNQANVTKSLGDTLAKLAENETAFTSYEEAQRLYKAAVSERGEADTVIAVADLHFSLWQYEPAQTHYEEALAIYRRIEAHRGEANALMGLARIQFELGNDEKSEELVLAANAIYEAIGSQRGTAYALTMLGHISMARGRFQSARERYEAAGSYHAAIGAWREAAESCRLLGTTYRGSHERKQAHAWYRRALQAYQDAQQVYRQRRLLESQARTYRAMGDLLNEALNDYAAAQQSYEQAYTLFSDCALEREAADMLKALGDVQAKQGKIAEALATFGTLRDTYERLGDQRNMATALYRIGQIFRSQGQLGQAEALLSQALGLARQYAPRHPGTQMLGDQVDSLRNGRGHKQAEDLASGV